MKIKIVSTSLMLLVGGMLAAGASEETNAFREVSEHYEAVRLSLVKDTMADVAEHAKAIEHRMHELAKAFDAHDAGVSADKSAECEALLPEISSAAARLAGTEDLEQAREALFELSKPMGRYRKLAGTEGTMVVFCSMAKKAWIQPHGEIGNPYLGQEMPTCGEVIAD
ncbi:MAG: DUF3347 domain-containing protein [Acidimicrobiia bacterium]|nr:DUF3347 domain-containing protein [Acidimicrobiia bacterium]